MENPNKMDDLGVPLFLETPMWIFIFFVFWRKVWVMQPYLVASHGEMYQKCEVQFQLSTLPALEHKRFNTIYKDLRPQKCWFWEGVYIPRYNFCRQPSTRQPAHRFLSRFPSWKDRCRAWHGLTTVCMEWNLSVIMEIYGALEHIYLIRGTHLKRLKNTQK